MKLYRADHAPSRPGFPDWFTGRVQGVLVTFDPGARTAWHTHPLGQTLVVTAGVGLCQSDGGPVRTIRPGDVVTLAPGELHWHGATPTNGMSRIAIHEVQKRPQRRLDGGRQRRALCGRPAGLNGQISQNPSTGQLCTVSTPHLPSPSVGEDGGGRLPLRPRGATKTGRHWKTSFPDP